MESKNRRDRGGGRDQRSLVVQLKVESVVDLVVLEGDVVLVDGVPLLEHDLLESAMRKP